MKEEIIKSPMKKLLFFFLLVPCFVFGQMQRQNYVGDPFNYVAYTNSCNSFWVIIQPGNGASGYTIDQIAAIGYGSLAKKQDLPFNVLIVQAKKGSGVDDYTPISKNWSSTFSKLTISKAALTGYSLGGQETIRQLWVDASGVFVGFVSMCGQYPYGPETQLKSNVVSSAPIFLLHGDKDTSISWYQSNTVLNMINKVHYGQAVMLIIPGGSHSDAWVKGYDPNNEYGKQVYNFLVNLK